MDFKRQQLSWSKWAKSWSSGRHFTLEVENGRLGSSSVFWFGLSSHLLQEPPGWSPTQGSSQGSHITPGQVMPPDCIWYCLCVPELHKAVCKQAELGRCQEEGGQGHPAGLGGCRAALQHRIPCAGTARPSGADGLSATVQHLLWCSSRAKYGSPPAPEYWISAGCHLPPVSDQWQGAAHGDTRTGDWLVQEGLLGPAQQCLCSHKSAWHQHREHSR